MQNSFKNIPKRFQPKGLTFIYEDRDILVVDKMASLLTVSTDSVTENTAYYILTEYVRKGNPKSRERVFIVHRLDRDTSGILVFAKSEQAKNYLQEEWSRFKKIYSAVVHGSLQKKEGIISTYLAENVAHRMYSTNDPKKGKMAKTGYEVLKESEKFSLLEIDLLTGKKNQIRVHLSEKGHPVAGDKVYGVKEKGKGKGRRRGDGIKRLMLHATSITLLHPYTKKTMTFESPIPASFKALVPPINSALV
jgi:RluA family pseudouridine synthase